MKPMKVVIEVDIPGLGEELKIARESLDLRPTNVAASIGMTAANLYRIEGEDNKSIPLDTLKRLGAVVGVNAAERIKKAVLLQLGGES